MATVRFGTVGYGYRDWAGIFFPPGSPPRRQFNIYASQFDVCELTQFMHQMPDRERMAGLAAQIRTDLKLFVRLHNSFTHCADAGLALALAKHFRNALEPLHAEGRLAGFVGAFPYAFKNSEENRDYIHQLARSLPLGADAPLQVDFRHASWLTADSRAWLAEQGIGLVCVDEPALPGLLPGLATATARRVLVRLHGRNAAGWWSGNNATRFDYSYSPAELVELRDRYSPLLEGEGAAEREVCFLFNNNWQAQSAANAAQFRALLADAGSSVSVSQESHDDEDNLPPPSSLPYSEVKSRVTRALSGLQGTLELLPRDE